MKIPMADVVELVKQRIAAQSAMHAMAGHNHPLLMFTKHHDAFLAVEAWEYTVPLMTAIRPWVWKLYLDAPGFYHGYMEFEFHTPHPRHAELEPLVVRLCTAYLAQRLHAMLMEQIDPEGAAKIGNEAQSTLNTIKTEMRQASLRASHLPQARLAEHFY